MKYTPKQTWAVFLAGVLTMKPEASVFQTGFLTEAGNVNTDKQYFVFAEKEGLACWIVAEQIDSDEKESAKLAADQLLGDWSEKPTLNRNKLKEYLINAHQKLVKESRNIMLKVSLVMVVSDYSKMVWAVSGNVRLYHFRDGVFNFRSKDQTMAQVMLDAGNLKEDEINRRNERSGLINYLGISTEFKPLVSEVYQLREGDKILLCNLGLWEKVSVQDLEEALKADEEPVTLLTQLQENYLAKSDKPLKPFIGTLIHVKKIGGKKFGDYLTPQNVAACLSVLAIVGAVWLVGTVLSQNGVEPKLEKPKPGIRVKVKKQPVGTQKPPEDKETVTVNKAEQIRKSETENQPSPRIFQNQNQGTQTETFTKHRKADQEFAVADAGRIEPQRNMQRNKKVDKRRQPTTDRIQKPADHQEQRLNIPADAPARNGQVNQTIPQKHKPGAGTERQRETTTRISTKEIPSENRQPETETRRPRPTETAATVTKQRNSAEPKQRNSAESQARRDGETPRKQGEAVEQQRRQNEAEAPKRLSDEEERQLRRKEAEAERRRKLKEAEEARKQQEAETKTKTGSPDGLSHSGSPLSESSDGVSLNRDTKIAHAKALEKNGDEKYEAQKYSEALDLYKLAQRAYAELGMSMDAARVDQKINITIKKKLESFLKRQLKKE